MPRAARSINHIQGRRRVLSRCALDCLIRKATRAPGTAEWTKLPNEVEGKRRRRGFTTTRRKRGGAEKGSKERQPCGSGGQGSMRQMRSGAAAAATVSRLALPCLRTVVFSRRPILEISSPAIPPPSSDPADRTLNRVGPVARTFPQTQELLLPAAFWPETPWSTRRTLHHLEPWL